MDYPDSQQERKEMYIPLMQHPGLTQWQLSPDDIFEEIEHDLRGEKYDKATDTWIQYTEPIVNEKGIGEILSVLHNYIHKNTFLSNLTEKEIHVMICLPLMINISELLYFKWEEFGMKKTDMTMLVDKIDHIVFISLKRAFLEGERKFLKYTEKRVEERTMKPQEKKFSIFGLFKGGEHA